MVAVGARTAVAGLALAPLLWGCGAASRVPEPDAGQATTTTPTRGPAVEATEVPAPEPRGSADWRIDRQSRRGEVAAYTTRARGLPGTRVGLKVSTTEGGWEVAAFRIGSYAGGTGAFVWESGFRLGRRQPPARFSDHGTRTVVAPWARDLTVDTTGWAPGFYVFRLRTDTGWETQVPYVVTSPSAAGTVALVAPITTWQAYNEWGGYSLYAGPPGDRSSQRLFVVGADGTGARQLTDAPGIWWDIDATWSPTGDRIAFDRYEQIGPDWFVRPLAIVDVATGDVREVGPIPIDARAADPNPADPGNPGEGFWFEWSPDGTTLLAVPGEATARCRR